MTCLLFSTCKKEELLEMPVYLPGDISKGWADMTKNGVGMKASGTSVQCVHLSQDQTGLFFTTYDGYGVLSEYFFLGCFDLRLGKYQLFRNNFNNGIYEANYYTIIEDQVEDYYYLNERKPNFLQITDIDTNTGWIGGVVNMHFNHDKDRKPKEYAANPDKVHFYGTFRIKLPD
jgi:hypothetical protein